MRIIIEHHHYFHDDEGVKGILHSINKTLLKMNEELQQIKTDLVAANEKADKVAADVTLLHTKIDSIPGLPTAEEWAEVKTLSSNLNSKLQTIDDQTAEETAP